MVKRVLPLFLGYRAGDYVEERRLHLFDHDCTKTRLILPFRPFWNHVRLRPIIPCRLLFFPLAVFKDSPR